MNAAIRVFFFVVSLTLLLHSIRKQLRKKQQRALFRQPACSAPQGFLLLFIGQQSQMLLAVQLCISTFKGKNKTKPRLCLTQDEKGAAGVALSSLWMETDRQGWEGVCCGLKVRFKSFYQASVNPISPPCGFIAQVPLWLGLWLSRYELVHVT